LANSITTGTQDHNAFAANGSGTVFFAWQDASASNPNSTDTDTRLEGQAFHLQQATAHTFTGQNYSDILWRDGSTGDTGYSDIQGNAFHSLGGSSVAESVVGVGDFNGDGFSDILWRNNSTGDTGYSDIHGNAFHSLGGSSPAYSV